MNLIQVEANQLKSQSGAVVYFLQRLDIEMVNDILDENRTYQDLKKHIFIQKLGNALDEFISAGDTFLNCYRGYCNAEICNYKCSGYSFVGNNSNFYMDLIIDVKEGVVHDIYECSDFKHLEPVIKKRKRIRIDNSSFPF